MVREGKPTRSPEAALPSGGGCGLPLGGPEETSGYVMVIVVVDLGPK